VGSNPATPTINPLKNQDFRPRSFICPPTRKENEMEAKFPNGHRESPKKSPNAFPACSRALRLLVWLRPPVPVKRCPPSRRHRQGCLDCGRDTSFATGLDHSARDDVWLKDVRGRHGTPWPIAHCRRFRQHASRNHAAVRQQIGGGRGGERAAGGGVEAMTRLLSHDAERQALTRRLAGVFPTSPSLATRNWLTSHPIAWAKGRACG
jgi:hypothetical protein